MMRGGGDRNSTAAVVRDDDTVVAQKLGFGRHCSRRHNNNKKKRRCGGSNGGPWWLLIISSITATAILIITSFAVVVVVPTIAAAAVATSAEQEEEVECHVDGTCTTKNDESDASDDQQCGLYMALSSIPNAGWGIYAGVDIAPNTTPSSLLSDVVIQMIDANIYASYHDAYYFSNNNTTATMPPSITQQRQLFAEYTWSSSTTSGYYDADYVETIAPGFGTLTNGHMGLFNIEQGGCRSRSSSLSSNKGRQDPSIGASSHYQDCIMTTTKFIPAGHELLANYGDDWFQDRRDLFGDDIPLHSDYVAVDKIIRHWLQTVDEQEGDGDMAYQLWDTIVAKISERITPGAKRLLPASALDALRLDYTFRDGGIRNSIAYNEVPDVIRSISWLETRGMCLDHIAVQPIIDDTTTTTGATTDGSRRQHGAQERTAVARRFLRQGMVVAPAPLLHMSRQQLTMLHIDARHGNNNNKRSKQQLPPTIVWRGYQLLLNYCYGHPTSSIVLFPYSPGVNLINHADRSLGQIPNVGIRWSSKMTHPEWLQYNTSTLLQQNNHTGLMMEFYALRDIAIGEEILLDYGDTWQKAWDKHVAEWQRQVERDTLYMQNKDLASSSSPKDDATFIVHAKDYISAYDYEQQCYEEILQDMKYKCMFQPPSWIEVRCWIHPAVLVAAASSNDVTTWIRPNNNDDEPDLDVLVPCQVSSVQPNDGYNVQVAIPSSSDVLMNASTATTTVTVTKVPRSAIYFFDHRYTNNQLLRQAFRHEIQLPDDMIPKAWQDLIPPPEESSQCGLYMAESAIPHSGLGMYTAKTITKGNRIFHGDVVVQVEDLELNTKLRHWYEKDFDYTEVDWLLYNYYWNPRNSMGNFEAESVESIIPGLGMLANSHTGLVNADIKSPRRFADLHRGTDPGTGASTTFHDVHFTATQDIEAGAELFVEYGDSWFEDREDVMGKIPLSDDFDEADKSLRKLLQVVNKSGKKRNKEMMLDALQLLQNMTSTRPRMVNAIPNDLDGLQRAVEKGTADLSVPNRVRSIDWLKQNGQCLDNIRPDISTIRQAGRGAFATRRIQKGDVISPMPLVHIRRRHMGVYGGDDYNDKDADVWIDGAQQLLNYCYGHPESSILLFPYSPVVNYVNHQDVQTANAELRWSSLPNHHAEWLVRTPDDLDSEDHAGLIMELVATRDIAAGEEVFLYYGRSWETSWAKYLSQWKPTEDDKQYFSTAELNQRLAWIKTYDELETSPYPFSNGDDIITVCFVGSLGWADDAKKDDKGGRTISWTGAEDLFDTSNYAYPCVILERHYNETMYSHPDMVYDRSDSVEPVQLSFTVRLKLKTKTLKVENVPRKAIQFFDAKYMSDNSFRSAFRHEIHLPDNMVPNAWRDMKR